MHNKIIWKRMIYHGSDLGDFYLVSDTGEIRGVKSGIIRKKNINHEGYYFVGVSLEVELLDHALKFIGLLQRHF